ncbi:hypothetical protein BDZ91DRAFT_768484 [Kalaharituber pfeilii]|nr:hypothetical protein BDZ91DRAFT_768484 [Kalaharituber pfeilii]
MAESKLRPVSLWGRQDRWPKVLKEFIHIVGPNLNCNIKVEAIDAMDRAMGDFEVHCFPGFGLNGITAKRVLTFMEPGDNWKMVSVPKAAGNPPVLPFQKLPEVIEVGLEVLETELLEKVNKPEYADYARVVKLVRELANVRDKVIGYLILVILTLGKISPLPTRDETEHLTAWCRHRGRKELHHEFKVGFSADFSFAGFNARVAEQYKIQTSTLLKCGFLKCRFENGKFNPKMSDVIIENRGKLERKFDSWVRFIGRGSTLR